MKFDGDKKDGTSPGKLPWRPTDEAARSFARSLAEGINVNNRGTIALFRRSSRSQAFSRKIASQRSEVCGADPLSFLSSQLGNKFTPVQTRGFSGERIYKHPGQFFRHTSYNSVTELCMSFNFKQLARNVQLLLSQIHTTQIFTWTGNTRIENKTISASRAREELPRATKLSLVTRWSEALQSPQAMRRSEPTQRPATMHLKLAMQWSQWMKLPRAARRLQGMLSPQPAPLTPSLLLLRPVARSAREFLVRLPSSQATKPGEAETHATDRLFIRTKLERWDTERARVRQRNADRIPTTIANVPGQALAKATYVRYVDKSLQPHLTLASPSPVPTVAGEPWLRTGVRQRRPSGAPFSLAGHTTKVRSDFLRFKQLKVRPRSLDASFAFIPPAVLRTLKRSMWLTDRSQFETKRFKPPVQAPVTAEVSRNLKSASELTLVRKEGALRAPLIDFVFAQPTRQRISEERVVKHLEQREIVELVRKAVKQSMTPVSPLQYFTREDYVEISDHVYSTLVKRLTVERERPGLR